MRPSLPHPPQGGCAANQDTELFDLGISGAYLPQCPNYTTSGSKEMTQGPSLPHAQGRSMRCWQWTLWQELRQQGKVSAALVGTSRHGLKEQPRECGVFGTAKFQQPMANAACGLTPLMRAWEQVQPHNQRSQCHESDLSHADQGQGNSSRRMFSSVDFFLIEKS